MKKRNHRNTSRLTAKERAKAVMEWWIDKGCIQPASYLRNQIERALQAHVRAALRRARRRS